MKKIRVIMVIALVSVVLTGCKKQAQQEFAEELIKQGEMNSGEFTAEIDKVTIEAKDADAPTRTMTDMAAKMFSGTKISGNYLIDFKKELLETDMTVDSLGQKLPIDLYIDGKRPSVYMGTAFMSNLVDILKEFNPDIPFDTEMFENLEGKYILDDQKNSKGKDSSKTDVSALSKSLNSELFIDYLGTLESDSFEKKEDTIKRTFTKKDIQKFIKFIKENGDKDVKKDAKELEKNIDDLVEYKQTVILNTKKHTQKSTMKITVKSDETTGTIDLTTNNQAKDSNKKIKLPKATDTISMEEFEQIMEDAQKNSSMISEEDFNELLDTIRSNGSQLSQTEIEQFKSTYKPYLTDEQYKQFEEALDQAVQMAA